MTDLQWIQNLTSNEWGS